MDPFCTFFASEHLDEDTLNKSLGHDFARRTFSFGGVNNDFSFVFFKSELNTMGHGAGLHGL